MLPPAQIMEFVANKFAKIGTLKITQLTRIKNLDQEEEKVFGEIIYLRSPSLYRSEVAGQPEKRLIIHRGTKTLRIIDGEIVYQGESRDPLFRFLMLAQRPSRLSKRLRVLGIDLDKVSLTRFEDKIAYMIGNKEEGSPRLLVDKDLFLPLLLQYGSVLFQFSDYRELKKRAWYPYKITYSFNGAIVEEYTVKEIKVNSSLDLSLFDIPLISSQFGRREPGPEKQ